MMMANKLPADSRKLRTFRFPIYSKDQSRNTARHGRHSSEDDALISARRDRPPDGDDSSRRDDGVGGGREFARRYSFVWNLRCVVVGCVCVSVRARMQSSSNQRRFNTISSLYRRRLYYAIRAILLLRLSITHTHTMCFITPHICL